MIISIAVLVFSKFFNNSLYLSEPKSALDSWFSKSVCSLIKGNSLIVVKPSNPSFKSFILTLAVPPSFSTVKPKLENSAFKLEIAVSSKLPKSLDKDLAAPWV